MKFGVREIVDVVFKATANGQRIGDKTFKKYQPVFMIDTATTSSLEQATTTVYAQGGKGYNRLIAWEGEKTMTFTVTDALMSPMGLAVLTGAGLITPNKSNQTHVHTTINAYVDANGEATISLDDLNQEMGLDAISYDICNTIDKFATELDGSGAGINWFDEVSIKGATDEYVNVTKDTPVTFVVNGAKNITVQLDFYVIMNNAVTEVHIEPGSFGGYFYVEAQTLFRREDTGKDMAAELIIPKAKVQSAFTFTMAASGDPSTFDFVMDAFPGYTRFDSTTKKMCVIQIVGVDKPGEEESNAHSHDEQDPFNTPAFEGNTETRFRTAVDKVSADEFEDMSIKENQSKVSLTKTTGTEDNVIITVDGGADSLNSVVPTGTTWPAGQWVALDYNTGEDTIVGISYKSLTNGSEHVFDQTDVDEAEGLGLGAGHFVLWTRADGSLPAEFELRNDTKTVKASVDFK
jgi:hypothetical protein